MSCKHDRECQRANRLSWHNASPSAHTISVLAVLETLVAIGIYAYIAFNFGTLHLTVSAMIAPLLLLRTERSTEIGLQLMERVRRTSVAVCDKLSLRWSQDLSMIALIVFFLLPMIAVSCLIVRIIATMYCTVRAPLQALRAIPSNWFRSVARVDSTTVLEAIPGSLDSSMLSRIGDCSHGCWVIDRDMFLDDWYQSYGAWDRFVVVLMALVYYPSVGLPAIIYRWSVKGTALIYSPLIYIVATSFSDDTTNKLLDIKELAVHRLVRIYSVFVILIFVAKIYLFSAWSHLSGIWNKIPAVDLVNAYVVPEAIPPWHIVALLNACLTWLVFFCADYMLARLNRNVGSASVPRYVTQSIQWIWFVRGLMSLYTIACALYITASMVPQVDWPPLGPRPFPWSSVP